MNTKSQEPNTVEHEYSSAGFSTGTHEGARARARAHRHEAGGEAVCRLIPRDSKRLLQTSTAGAESVGRLVPQVDSAACGLKQDR